MTAPVKAAGIGHGKADDEAQCTGPSDPVLRRDWYRPCRGRNHGAGNAGRGAQVMFAHSEFEREVRSLQGAITNDPSFGERRSNYWKARERPERRPN